MYEAFAIDQMVKKITEKEHIFYQNWRTDGFVLLSGDQ